MTVLLDTQTLSDLDRVAGGVVSSTFAENWAASHNDFVRNSVFDAARRAELEIVAEQYQRARALGIDLPRYPEGRTWADVLKAGQETADAASRRALTRDPSVPTNLPFWEDRNALRPPPHDYVKAARQAYDAAVEAVNRGRGLDATQRFMTLAEVREEARLRAGKARQDRADAAARAESWTSDVAAFAGDLTGALTDPVNVVASIGGAPAAARSLLRAVLTEAGINVGAEAFIQTRVVPWLEEQGVPHEDALTAARDNIVFAAVFGALLGGGLHGGARLARFSARTVRRVVGAIRERRLAKLGDIALEELQAKAPDLPPGAAAEAAHAADTLREAQAAEATVPVRGREPDALSTHARNIAEADAAIREGRRPDPIRVEGTPRSRAPASLLERIRPDSVVALRNRITPEGRIDVPAEFKPTAEDLAAARDVRRGGLAKADQPETLSQWVRKQGGIDQAAPEAGDLRASGITPLTKLLRKSGNKVDDLALRAQEAGFFAERDLAAGDRITTDAFLSALIDDHNGLIRHVRGEDVGRALHADELARLRQAIERRLDLHLGDLTDREVAYALAVGPDALRTGQLAERQAAGTLTEADALELAVRLDRDMEAAKADDIGAAIEVFDRELEADPELAHRMATERELTLAEMEALHADADAAAARGSEAARLAQEPAAPGRGPPEAVRRPGQEPQAATAAPGGAGPADAGRAAGEGVARSSSAAVAQPPGHIPDPAAIPHRGPDWLDNLEAAAADTEAQRAVARDALDQLDVADLRERAGPIDPETGKHTGDPVAGDLLDLVDEQEARAAAAETVLTCLGDFSNG